MLSAVRIPLKCTQERILKFIFRRAGVKMQGKKRNLALFKREIENKQTKIIFPK